MAEAELDIPREGSGAANERRRRGHKALNTKRPPSICYLCGKPLEKDSSREHVVPRQFYPSTLRRGKQLLTLPVHSECNTAYGKDEEYFLQSLGPVSFDMPVGKELAKEIRRRYRRAEGKRLYEMVRREFETRPGGIHLPHGLVAKRFDPHRIFRVCWKITRGLYFHSEKRFLPEQLLLDFRVIGPHGETLPEDDLYYHLKTEGVSPEAVAHSHIGAPLDAMYGQIWYWGYSLDSSSPKM